jgi:hypothetical protein
MLVRECVLIYRLTYLPIRKSERAHTHTSCGLEFSWLALFLLVELRGKRSTVSVGEFDMELCR